MTNIINYLFIFIGSLFLPAPPKYELLSNKIVANTSKKISQTQKLTPIGSGGSMMDDIKMLSISFTTKELLTEEKGRELILFCANELIGDINKNKEIRPYLHNYPFDDKNISIRIFCHDQRGDTAPPPHIGCLTLVRGEISYKYYKNDKRVKLTTETFAEAEQILKKEQTHKTTTQN